MRKLVGGDVDRLAGVPVVRMLVASTAQSGGYENVAKKHD